MGRQVHTLFGFVKLLSRWQKQMVLLLLDPAVVILAAAVTLALFAPPEADAPAWLFGNHAMILLTALVALGAGFALGLHRVQLKSYELSSVGRSAVLAAAVAIVLGAHAGLGQRDLMPGAALTFGLMSLCLGVLVRMALLQILLRVYSENGAPRRVLIYGAGATGAQLAFALKTHGDIEAVAFIDDNPVLHGMRVAGLPVHPANKLRSLIPAHGLERVLLAMPQLGPAQRVRIARRIAALGIEVQALPSFAQLVGEEAILDQLAPVLPESFVNRKAHDRALGTSSRVYRDKTVMVTGAGGSIGSELCRQVLACAPRRLVLLELSELALYTIERELRSLAEGIACEIVPVLGTVTDRRQVRATLERHDVQIVLHAAAYKHVPLLESNAAAALTNNVIGTATLAQEAVAHGVERLIHVSTDKAVRPVGLMGASKRLSELVIADLARDATGTTLSMVRFGNVLGSSGSVIPLFREQVERGGPVTVTARDVTRYFMTIAEAAKLVLRAGAMAEGGEVFVLDMGKPVRIVDLARQVIEASGYSVRDAANPDGDIDIVITGLRPGEKTHEELSILPDRAPTAHPKIFTTSEIGLSSFETRRAMQALSATLARGDDDAARAEAMHWVQRDLSSVTDAVAQQR